MFNGYHFALFNKAEEPILIAYKSSRNLDNEIEDAMISFFESLSQWEEENMKDEDAIAIVMNSFNVSWKRIYPTTFIL